MAKENEGERSERPHKVTRRQERRRPQRGATATYDDKFRRLMLIVAGTALEPSVPIPPLLLAQAQATLRALVAAEFGDELNVPRETQVTLEDDTWPDASDFEPADLYDPSDE